jgi:hypothetical protein
MADFASVYIYYGLGGIVGLVILSGLTLLAFSFLPLPKIQQNEEGLNPFPESVTMVDET